MPKKGLNPTSPGLFEQSKHRGGMPTTLQDFLLLNFFIGREAFDPDPYETLLFLTNYLFAKKAYCPFPNQ